MLVIWMGVYNATLRLCGEPLKNQENMLLTIYSTLANFFLPLQSGPGIRAGYLKKKHKVPISTYIMSTLIYYGMYAVISAGFLFVAASYWWVAVPAVIGAAAVSLGVIYIAKGRLLKNRIKYSPQRCDKAGRRIEAVKAPMDIDLYSVYTNSRYGR